MNEAMGEQGSPDNPLREGEVATIGAVVEGFLRNDAGFSRADVSSFVNSALQNEAGDLWRNRGFALDVAESFENFGTEDASRKAEIAREQSDAQYNGGRSSLGDAVREAQRSGKVALDQETCDWVVKLDHDGLMSEAMNVDVKAMFGRNPGFDPTAAARAAAMARVTTSDAPRPDFTRVPQARHGSPTLDRAPQVTRASLRRERLAEQPDPSREPVKAGRAVDDFVASLRAGENLSTSADTARGPELG